MTGLTIGLFVSLGLIATSAPILLWKLTASVPDLMAVEIMKGPEYRFLLMALLLCSVANVALLIANVVGIFSYYVSYVLLCNIILCSIGSIYLFMTLFMLGSTLAQFSYECKDIATKKDSTVISSETVRTLGQFRLNISMHQNV